MSHHPPPRPHAPASTTQVLSRVAAGLLGGWALVWGVVTLLITSLVALGQPYDEAHTAAMLLAFLVFLAVFCWAFVARSLLRLWAVLAGGAVLMTTAAWLLQASLLQTLAH